MKDLNTKQEDLVLEQAREKICVSCGDMEGVNEYEVEEGDKVLLCDYCYEQVLECGEENYDECDYEQETEEREKDKEPFLPYQDLD